MTPIVLKESSSSFTVSLRLFSYTTGRKADQDYKYEDSQLYVSQLHV